MQFYFVIRGKNSMEKTMIFFCAVAALAVTCIAYEDSVDGNWGAWLEWDPCTASCGEGERRRMRFCNNPPPRNGGAYCAGRAIEYQECVAPIGCPVNGEWSEWSPWTPCSVTCGEGIKSRQRNCDSPPPANGGRNCAESSTQRTRCASGEDCPRNGGWSQWSKWSPCFVTFGGGVSFRYRECDNPPPSDNGKDCPGRTQDTRECTAKREWADTPVCTSPPDIEDAITSQLNHPVGTSVTYTCPYGFESRNSSNNVSVCTANPITGRPEWTAPEIRCIVITCDPPKNIENGHAIALSFEYGSELEYTCDKGFSLNTNETIYCTEDGTWSKTDVACIVITCDPPKDIENGHTIEAKYALSFEYGSELDYKCDKGFNLNTNETIYCTEDGKWSKPDVACIVITCDPPKNIENGHAIVLSFEYGSELEYKCDKGFSLNTNETIYCTEDGIWSKTDVACIVITCNPPKNIENGHAIALSFEYGSELEYKCDKGFSLNTDETIYCTEDGKWSKTDVACIVISDQDVHAVRRSLHSNECKFEPEWSVMCNGYNRVLFDELFYEPCGDNRMGRNMPSVTGLMNATEGNWPWMAAIQRTWGTGSFVFHCTGFLIDKKHVVSEAHCFKEKEPHLYRVKLGSVDMEAGEEYTISRIVFHRGFTLTSGYGPFYDNIAIFTLSRDVDIPNFVPVCLPDNRIINMDLTGKGTTLADWTGHGRRFLKQMSGTHVLSNEECETPIREHWSTSERGLTSGMFCARYELVSGGVCRFVSGSPLMLLDRNRWYAVGIFSIHLTCEPSSSTVVYTRVTSYLDWITENTRD